jgi:hypothetical protein
MSVSNSRRTGGAPSGGGTSRSGFNYRPRSAETAAARVSKYQTGNKEGYLPPNVDTFTPKEGDNWIRILPPTWDEADHYALDMWVHYEVGPDNNTYLCLEKMKGEFCPLCAAKREADAHGEKDYARALECGHRLGAWVIDRENESKGPLLWFYSKMIDQDLLLQARDRRSGEVLPIDHPEEGYDVEFNRKGKGMTTKYSGVRLARQPSAVKPAWLDFVAQNPIPNILVYHSAERISEVFTGAGPLPADNAPPADERRAEDPPPRQPRNETPPQREPVRSQPQPRQSTAAAEQPATNNARRRAAAPKGPDFEAMSVNDLLDYADKHNIVIPDNVPDEGIPAFLREQTPN